MTDALRQGHALAVIGAQRLDLRAGIGERGGGLVDGGWVGHGNGCFTIRIFQVFVLE